MPLCASLMAAGALSAAVARPFQGAAIFVALFLFLLAACAVLWRRTMPHALRALLFAGLCFYAAGFLFAHEFVRRAADVSVPVGGGARILCEGVVTSPPSKRSWGIQADVKLAGCATDERGMREARGLVRLSIGDRLLSLSPGERIRFRARFSDAREMKNPGSFSYRSYLLAHGIGAVGSAYGSVEALGAPDSLRAAVEGRRLEIARQISDAVPPPARDIVIALANGDQSGIDPDVRESFADTGLAHLIAISGLNVGYVAAFVYLLSRLVFWFFPSILLRVPVRVLAAAVTIPALWLYVMFTGSALSAVRAGIMLTVFLAGAIAGRRQDLLSTLSVSVAVILFILPLSVLDLSFQLSVAAVLGIILVSPRLVSIAERRLPRDRPWGRALLWLWSLAAVSAAATLFTAPIIAYSFKFLTGISLVANIIAVPATGIVLSPVVAVASAVGLISSSAAAPLWWLAWHAADLFISFARLSSELGRPLILRFAPSLIEVALIYASIAAVLFRRRMPYGRAAALALVACIAFDSGYWHMRPIMAGDLTITVFDAGQGDSTLVRFPGGKTLLIDGGGIKGSSFDVGRNVIAPALWRMGIHSIDWMLLTHPHYDHYRGLGFLAAAFRPERVYANGLDAPAGESADWKGFLSQLDEAGVPLVSVADAELPPEIDGAALRVIAPSMPAGSDLNDSSLVVDISFGSRRFLFMGDTTREGERALISSGANLSASFLKVGHHGSADSTSMPFLDAVRPEVAAISAGEHNRYGVPAKATLDRLAAAGARVYRTDEDGAITVRSDGMELKVETFVKR